MNKLRYILLMLLATTLATANAQTAKGFEKYMPKAVDLGLPSGTLWADRNMAVNDQPGNGGVYYSWGSIVSSDEDMDRPIEQQHRFTWRKYEHGSSKNALKKYCTDSAFGTKDDKTQLDPADDAAATYAKNHKTPIWDASWHIPTEKEFAELIEKCKWTWQNGGYKIVGPNGNSIYLPGAGWAGHTSPYDNTGMYWTSTLCPEFPCYAYAVMFDEDFITWNNTNRNIGCSVRPVKSKK
ncbi:MAG: hypothetical protein J5616_00640 [Bacteroidaceae bacterium]|nr:hypothetical protein [Bacteroidaceae bacterium]